ncbi:MAG: HigA family addiction module antidote protein [Chlamydiia bacterium]|nr:HigA family addiction module antidote protein [Chlamydiia bacterium]
MLKRRPTHPGIILEEDYIKQLKIKNLHSLADAVYISRKTLYKLRAGNGRVTPEMALRLSKFFRTTPELWLNLEQKYDLWIAWRKHPEIDIIQAIA